MFKFFLCLCLFFCSDFNQPQVSIRYGSLRGKWMKSRNGRSFIGFEGVPFAKPPLGDLRFKAPVPPDRWEGLKSAVTPGNECLQYDFLKLTDSVQGNEDCLYLSVFTPDVIFSNLIPVLVYFHGGAFEFGAGQSFHGPEYLMDEKIVLVSVNYRLGTLGFLSFEDEELPGNMGLKDQVLALNWVRENIAAFGGHPKKVTIMGESAGSVSVNFHMISPLSKGLFDKAISMSGTAYAPWSVVKPGVARERAITTAEAVGCSYNNTKEVINCLRNKNATELVRIRSKFSNELRDPLVFYGPVIDSKSDKPFLPSNPKNLPHKSVPWLLGISTGEGLLKTGFFTDFKESDWNTLDANINNIIRTSVLNDKTVAGDDMLAEEIRQFYFNNNPLTNDSFANLTNLYTDGWFLNPTIKGISKHKGPIYLYYFDYTGIYSLISLVASRKILTIPFHTDETIYLFNLTNPLPPLMKEDELLSRTMVKLWTNFVKHGSPNNRESVINWKKTNKEDYLHINNKGYTMENNILNERTQFWKNISSKYNI